MKKIASFIAEISSVLGSSKGLGFAQCLGADLTQNHNLLLAAIRGNHMNTVQYLLDAGADVHQNCDFAVGLAASLGYTELTRLLIMEGANFRASNNWALRWAARNGHAETVDYLLFMGADYSDCDYYSVLISIEKGYSDIVKLFLDRGSKIPNVKYHIARCGEKGHIKLMKMLIAHSNKKILRT